MVAFHAGCCRRSDQCPGVVTRKPPIRCPSAGARARKIARGNAQTDDQVPVGGRLFRSRGAHTPGSSAHTPGHGGGVRGHMGGLSRRGGARGTRAGPVDFIFVILWSAASRPANWRVSTAPTRDEPTRKITSIACLPAGWRRIIRGIPGGWFEWWPSMPVAVRRRAGQCRWARRVVVTRKSTCRCPSAGARGPQGAAGGAW